jgi:site-specific recombinase XerD
MVVVGIDTGLRRTTLVRLRGEWLHEDASVVMIPRRRTKGKKAPITIPLTTRAVRIIRRHVDASTGEFVFVRRDGRPYHPDQVGARFRRVAHSAGIPDVSLHTLRHTFVSRLVQEGRPLTEVAALAGHRDIRMTARYAHLATEHLTNAVRALERRRRRYEVRTRPRPSRRLPL